MTLPVDRGIPRELAKAIIAAHHAAECGDYYCGCWDSSWNDPGHKYFRGEAWPHTSRFLDALRARGYDVVPVDATKAGPEGPARA